MITASSLPRVSVCPASAVLPQTPEAASPYADRGTAIHGYLAEYLRNGRDRFAALATVAPEYYSDCESIHVSEIPQWTRMLVEQHLRDHEFNVSGTADVLVLDEEPDVIVVDWKTGHEINRERYRAQIEHYALLAAREHDAWSAHAALAWVRDDGGIVWDRWEVDLAAARSRAERTLSAITADDAARRTAVGPHCRYCPAWRHCPAQRALVELLSGERVEEIDPVALYDAAKAAERAASTALELLRERLRAGNVIPGLALTTRGALKRTS